MKIPLHLMSECNIQSEFYHVCKLIGLNCTLELHTPAGRVDCAIFSTDWKSLLAVVECKRHDHGKMKETSQIKRYKRLGVPVYGLTRMDSISLAQRIKSLNYSGIPWNDVESIPRIRRNREIMVEGVRHVVLNDRYSWAD